MRTDIVIPVHNALDYTKKCIESIYEHTPAGSFRLITVDDFSDAPTREFLYGAECTGRDKRNIYIRTNRQSWFTRASNLGLRLVNTDWAVLLNSDCVVNDGWIDELYGVMDDYGRVTPGKQIGLVGHWYQGENVPRWKETREPDYVTGHCFLLNMSAMHAIANQRGTPGRLLDETKQDAIHINSDRYANYELNRLGYATLVSYKAPVGHYGSKSWGANVGQVFAIQLKDLD